MTAGAAVDSPHNRLAAIREETQRIPALDGWRGIAILLVLIDHIQRLALGHYARPWAVTGQHGVTIFFVLSGFLITSKLLEGPIKLKEFYLRRFFRLMPAAWTYLAVLMLLSRLTRAPFTTPAEVRACLLFYRNFVTMDGLAGHFWSLSLEEQFYLVWPCILLLAGVPRCRWIAAAGAAACAFYRWLFWPQYDHFGPSCQTQVRADALLVGCLLALLLAKPSLRAVATRWAKFWVIPAVTIALFCMARFHNLPPLCECVAIAGLIAASVLHPTSILVRPLAFGPLVWLGVVSYSVYVWQQVFMFVTIGHEIVRVVSHCLVMFAFALGSYYWIERPSIRLGRRLTRERATAAKGVSSGCPA